MISCLVGRLNMDVSSYLYKTKIPVSDDFNDTKPCGSTSWTLVHVVKREWWHFHAERRWWQQERGSDISATVNREREGKRWDKNEMQLAFAWLRWPHVKITLIKGDFMIASSRNKDMVVKAPWKESGWVYLVGGRRLGQLTTKTPLGSEATPIPYNTLKLNKDEIRNKKSVIGSIWGGYMRATLSLRRMPVSPFQTY